MEIVWGRTAPNVFLAVMDVVATLLFIRVGVRACVRVCLYSSFSSVSIDWN